MPFPPRYRAKEYMAVNPLGTIPALVDGETFMTESAAIVQYLATRHGPSPLAVEAGAPAAVRGRALHARARPHRAVPGAPPRLEPAGGGGGRSGLRRLAELAALRR